MKKTIDKIAILLLMAFAVACVDEDKDPVKFDKIAKGTFLALRGDAFNALNATGCSNSFFKNNLLGNEVYSFDADYLSEDQESLQEVQLYASVVTTTKGGLRARPRKLVATVPGSAFTFPSGSTVKRGKVSVTLAKVMTELSISADSLVKLGYVFDANDEPSTTSEITMDVDLVLTDGSKILASDIVNPNLFQSVVFYPAMVLNYCANDVGDFLPTATTKMLGEYSKNATTGVVTRTVVPLKSGVSDTLYITYDQAVIKTPPTVAFTPSNHGGTVTKDVTPYKSEKNGFYLIYTAGTGFTGAVTATVNGAVASVAGVDLVQNEKKQTINVDNTPPQITTNVGSFRLGKGQFITLKVTYNEVMSRKSADAIKATITGQGLEAVTATTMALATDGLSASLIYIFKLADPLVAATHGNLSVAFTGGKDAAGNAAPVPAGSITVDVNAPPAPTLTLDGGGHDLGTQIKWSANETRDNTVTGNPNGDQTGKVYFIAITSGKPGPTAVSFDADGVASWTMPEDPASATDPKAKVAIRQSGIINITNTNGNSANPTFTPFTANGTLDIYAVFLGNTGNKSAITVTPQLTGVVMN